MGYTKEELKELRKDPNSDLSQVILNDHDTSNKFSTEIHQESVTDPGQTTTHSESNGETNQTSSSESRSEGTTSSVSGKRYAGWHYTNNTPDAGDVQRTKDADAAALRQAYSLSDAIGANREKIRKQREAERVLNEKRAKVASIADSARVIADIISAGAGGNVYAREKDTTAKEMDERNKQLRELQAAEDAQNALLEYQNNRDLALAILNRNDAIDERAATTFSNSQQNSKTEQTSEGKQTTHTVSDGTQDQAPTIQKSGYVKGTMPGVQSADKKKDMPGLS